MALTRLKVSMRSVSRSRVLPWANDKAFLAASGMCGRRTASSFCIVDFGCFEELLWEKAGEVLGHTDVGLASQKFG